MITLNQLRAKSPREFENYIAKLLPKLGYNKIKITSQTADSGYDIEAYKNNKKVLFECKRYSENNKVGSRDVRIFADACRRLRAQKGIFLTTSDFTKTVYEEQKTRKIDIKFWNGKELLRQIMNSKNIRAYCIQCKTPLKGYYKSFDWKENVASKPRFSNLLYSSEMKRQDIWMIMIYDQEGDLVPKNPRLCDKCKFFSLCKNCLKGIDVIMLTINKIQGCYWGLALGDALGMPIEFKLIEKIREIYGEGGIQNLEENSIWTDDTEMTIAVTNSLLLFFFFLSLYFIKYTN